MQLSNKLLNTRGTSARQTLQDTTHTKLLVEKWMQLIRLQGAHLDRMTGQDSRTPREKSFELHSRKYRIGTGLNRLILVLLTVFKRVDISKFKWFIPFINQGNSAEIQLPLNVFDDGSWLGFALCCQISTHYQNPNISLGSTAADSTSGVLYYRLDSDVAWHGLFDCWMQHGSEVLEPSATMRLGSHIYRALKFLTRCGGNANWPG